MTPGFESGPGPDSKSHCRYTQPHPDASPFGTLQFDRFINGQNLNGFADVKDRTRVVSVEEIKEEDWTLNISRYVLPPIGEDISPLPEAIADFKAALARVHTAEDKLRVLMAEGGWLDE